MVTNSGRPTKSKEKQHSRLTQHIRSNMDDNGTIQQQQKQRQFVRTACSRPRDQRAVLDSTSTRRCIFMASTGDDTRPGNDGVVKRLSATKQRRR